MKERKISQEEFELLASHPSPVCDRKQEFTNKINDFLSRSDLSELLKSEKLSDFPFIVIGMTIKGIVAHGIGFNFFVANGYPPYGMNFFFRHNGEHCKLIMSNCYEVVTSEKGDISLNYLFNDEDALDSVKIEKVMGCIISQRNGLFISSQRLALFVLEWNSAPLLCWFQCFEDQESGELYYLMCDIDAACLYIMQEKEFKKEGDLFCINEISFAEEAISSPFSHYLFNGRRLIRDEQDNAKGGVGVFFG